MAQSELIPGIIYAVQYLVLTRDEPLFAEEIMRDSGHSMDDFLKEQKETGFETRKINPVIRSAFADSTK